MEHKTPDKTEFVDLGRIVTAPVAAELEQPQDRPEALYYPFNRAGFNASVHSKTDDRWHRLGGMRW